MLFVSLPAWASRYERSPEPIGGPSWTSSTAETRLLLTREEFLGGAFDSLPLTSTLWRGPIFQTFSRLLLATGNQRQDYRKSEMPWGRLQRGSIGRDSGRLGTKDGDAAAGRIETDQSACRVNATTRMQMRHLNQLSNRPIIRRQVPHTSAAIPADSEQAPPIWTELGVRHINALQANDRLARGDVPYDGCASEREVSTLSPSGLNSARYTPALCFINGLANPPALAFHTHAVESALAVSTKRPSGLKVAYSTVSCAGFRHNASKSFFASVYPKNVSSLQEKRTIHLSGHQLDEIAHFVIDLRRTRHCVSDFLAYELAVTLPQPMHGHRNGCSGHS